MNSGTTMMRVYVALKRRIMTNGFRPGEKLDPGRLASELASSATPVRDALYRLSGERLIEAWQQEGFRIPLVTEASLRELYVWSAELVGVAIKLASRVTPSLPDEEGAYSILDIGDVFSATAAASRNFEIRAAIANLNDRCGVVRLVETRFLPENSDFDMIDRALRERRWPDLATAIEHYHTARLAIVPALAESLRPRHESTDPY
jgi:DNA-binding GntR family transcriptional regulator